MVHSSTRPVQRVAIVGTGLMGVGIAQVSLAAGLDVAIVGRSNERLNEAKAKITAGLSRSAAKSDPERQGSDDLRVVVDEQLSHLQLELDVDCESVSQADLVLEAVVEDLKVKQELVEQLETIVSPACILVTNTSSFHIGDVSTKLERRGRFAGLHFFNPVPAMRLVEVIRADDTDEATAQSLLAFCKKIGKSPVTCKDTSGFIVNRLLVPYLLEAMRMVERGDASLRDVDTAMRLGAGHPMGPLQLSDFIGLDTLKFAVDGWHELFPDDPRFEPCASLDRLVSEGKLGKKSREGFYKY